MVTYDIRVRGTIPAELVEELNQQIGAIRPAGTTLEVNVPDEAALWGLIDGLCAAGVDLLEVRRLSGDPAGISADPGGISADPGGISTDPAGG